MKDINYFKSLRKALSLLRCFTTQEMELSGAEIARKVGIHRTTAYRILAALAEDTLIERSIKTGKYRIGPALYALGSLYLSTTDFLKAAEPVIKTLNDLTGEAINIAILDKSNIIFVMKEETKDAFRLVCHIGSSFPAYATAMGKALLSELTETEIDNLFPEERLQPQTKKTIATKTELKQELEQIRKTGASFDVECNIEGAVGIASVIRDASGKAVAAISVTIPVLKMNQANCERLVTLIRLGSSLTSYRLGYQDTDNPVRDIQEILSWWEHNQLDSASQANNMTRPLAISYKGLLQSQ